MVIPTLLDVTSIIGLRSNGDVFDPTQQDKRTINFNSKLVIYNVFIAGHFETQTEDVSDEEHIDILTLWLSHYIFCSKSLKVAKKFVTLANQLHEG